MSDEEYKKFNLDGMEPSMEKDFLKRLNLIENKRMRQAKNKKLPTIQHNLQEYLKPSKVTTTFGRLSSIISSAPPISTLRWNLMSQK